MPMPDILHGLICGSDGWLSHRLDAPPDFEIDRNCPWLSPPTARAHRAPWLLGRDGCRPLDRLQAAARRANVAGMTFSSLRHSWATHSAHWGVPRGMARLVLRHTSERTMDWYTHDDLDNLRDATRHIQY